MKRREFTGREVKGTTLKRRTIERTMIFVLVIITVLMCGTRKVQGENQVDNIEQAEAFRNRATSVVREVMKDRLYSNSGVMLTSSFEGKSVNCFTVQVHHDRFAYLSDDEKQVLCNEIEHVLEDLWISVSVSQGPVDLANTSMTNPQFSIILE